MKKYAPKIIGALVLLAIGLLLFAMRSLEKAKEPQREANTVQALVDAECVAWPCHVKRSSGRIGERMVILRDPKVLVEPPRAVGKALYNAGCVTEKTTCKAGVLAENSGQVAIHITSADGKIKHKVLTSQWIGDSTN